MSPNSRSRRGRGGSVTFSEPSTPSMGASTPVKRIIHSKSQRALGFDRCHFLSSLKPQSLGFTSMAFACPHVVALTAALGMLERAPRWANAMTPSVTPSQPLGSSSDGSSSNNAVDAPTLDATVVVQADDVFLGAKLPLFVADQVLFTAFDLFDISLAVSASARKVHASLGDLASTLVPFDVGFLDDPRNPDEVRTARRMPSFDAPTLQRLLIGRGFDMQAVFLAIIDAEVIYEDIERSAEVKASGEANGTGSELTSLDDAKSPSAGMAMSFSGNPAAMLRAMRTGVANTVGTSTVAIVVDCSDDGHRVTLALAGTAAHAASTLFSIVDVDIAAFHRSLMAASPVSGQAQGLIELRIGPQPIAGLNTPTGANLPTVDAPTFVLPPPAVRQKDAPSDQIALPVSASPVVNVIPAQYVNWLDFAQRHHVTGQGGATTPGSQNRAPLSLELQSELNACSAVPHIAALSLALKLVTADVSIADISAVTSLDFNKWILAHAARGTELFDGSLPPPSVQQVFGFIKAVVAGDQSLAPKLRTVSLEVDRKSRRPDAPHTLTMDHLHDILRTVHAFNTGGAAGGSFRVALLMCINMEMAWMAALDASGGGRTRKAFQPPPVDGHWVMLRDYDVKTGSVCVVDVAPRFHGSQWHIVDASLHRALLNHGLIAIYQQEGNVEATMEGLFSKANTDDVDAVVTLAGGGYVPGINSAAVSAAFLGAHHVSTPVMGDSPLSLAACALACMGVVAPRSATAPPSANTRLVETADIVQCLPISAVHTLLDGSLLGMPDVARCVRQALKVWGVVDLACTAVHFSVVNKERMIRKVEFPDFLEALVDASKKPKGTQIILNYNPQKIKCLVSEKRCHGARLTDFALFLGFVPSDTDKSNPFVACCDANPNPSQRVWAVRALELYAACAAVCPVTGRTMGIISIDREDAQDVKQRLAETENVPRFLSQVNSFVYRQVGALSTVRSPGFAAIAHAFSAFAQPARLYSVDDVMYAYLSECYARPPAIDPVSRAALPRRLLDYSVADQQHADTSPSAQELSAAMVVSLGNLRIKSMTMKEIRAVVHTIAGKLGLERAQSELFTGTDANETTLMAMAKESQAAAKAGKRHVVLISYGTLLVHEARTDSSSFAIIVGDGAALPGSSSSRLCCIEVESSAWVDEWVRPASLIAESFTAADATRSAKRGILVIKERS